VGQNYVFSITELSQKKKGFIIF